MPDLDLEDSFGFLLNRLARAVEASFDAALARHGLTASGWGILKTLEQTGPCTLKELTASLGIDASNTGRQAERLAARGLASITRDENDARARRVALTDEGLGLLPELERLAREYNAHWLAPLPEDNRKILVQSLAKILTAKGIIGKERQSDE